jgi:hypothetical protein
MKTVNELSNKIKITINDGSDLCKIVGIDYKVHQDIAPWKAQEITSKLSDRGINVSDEEIISGYTSVPDGRKIRITQILKKYPDILNQYNNIQSKGSEIFRFNIHKYENFWVAHSGAKKGYGPLGYDICIEYATMNGS